MKYAPLAPLVFGLLLSAPAWAQSQVGGRVSPDGAEEVQLDLPGELHRKNTASKGLGNCVFTSIHHSALWQSVPAVQEFPKWLIDKGIPGGGYPEKVADLIPKIAKDRGLPTPEFVQHTGGDLSFLRLALRTGRMPGVTYGYSPRYGQNVSHMVTLVHLSEKWAAILDNNFPGEDKLEWMNIPEFERRWKLRGGGWGVVLLKPGPPPVPVARRKDPTVNPLLMATLLLTPGQWGAGGCPPVGGPRFSPPALTFPAAALRPAVRLGPHWQWKRGQDPDQVHLFRDGRQAGTYRYSLERFYRLIDYDRELWSGAEPLPEGAPRPPALIPEPAPPPEAEPVAAVGQLPDWMTQGVERDKVTTERRYWLGPREVSEAEARQAVAAGLVDDSNRLRVTLVGTKEECDRVHTDIDTHAAFAPLREKILVQCYRPDEWQVAKVGLAGGGHPTVWVQAPAPAGGKSRALHRQDDYADGPAGLAYAIGQAVGAKRDPDPNFDPKKVPDLRKVPSPDAPSDVTPLAVVGGAVVLLVLFAVARRAGGVA